MFRINMSLSEYLQRRKYRRRPQSRTAWIKWIAGGLAALMMLNLLVIVLLRWVDVPFSAFMLWHKLGGKKVVYHWVDWNQISPAAPIAVVAAEDQNFPFHHGFDFGAIAEALEENRHRNRPRGASTLSQQVAKNLFLWSGGGWLRKGLEAYLTVVIETCWSKKRILEVYLNIAQFGPQIFGVDAASRTYFGIPPARLSSSQAALLAAALPSPDHYHLDPPSPYVRLRAHQIEQQVRLLGGPSYLASLYGP
ncbi:MAG: monofunctional biosynthetic peptidoglycan transglycosylase [Desulfosarcinaceae bacterium]